MDLQDLNIEPSSDSDSDNELIFDDLAAIRQGRIHDHLVRRRRVLLGKSNAPLQQVISANI